MRLNLAKAESRARRLEPALVLIGVMCGVLLACLGPAQAQVATGGKGKNFVTPITDAQGRKTVLRGDSFRPAKNGLLEITGMRAESIRGQSNSMSFQAPQCLFDPRTHVAASSSNLTLRTTDKSLALDGVGFRWQMGDSRLNSKLWLSNRVHSLIRKRVEGASRAPSEVAPGKGTNDFIEVTSDAFEYQQDLAVYRGNVRAHEAEGDLTCGLLTIYFQGENNAVQRIEAEENVVLNQEATRAFADKAVYTVGNDKEEVDFSGHAHWTDGQREGSGERMTFDRRMRVLHSQNKAYLKLPRTVLEESTLLGGAPRGNPRPAAPPGSADTNSFAEVFSDAMTIALSPTNGPVQRILAEGNVMIVDPEEEGRALANRAEYSDATGVLELTGSPVLETARRLVTGDVLRFDRTNQVFSASPNAYLKLPLQALTQSGLLGAAVGTNAPTRTNQFIEVWCREFQYRTNLLQCTDSVRANLLEAEAARAKLTCDLLRIGYGEQIESMLAEGHVELEQVPSADDPHAVVRRASCPVLRAKFSAEGRLESAVGEQGVRAEQQEIRPGQPQPVVSTMTADAVQAFFARRTNRLEKMIADKDVVFTQQDKTAQGQKAVYLDATGLLELTGAPTATVPEGRITQAERLIWDRTNDRFIGKGKFKSEFKRTPGQTNQLSFPTARAKETR